MSIASAHILSSVRDVVELDFNYLTSLRNQLETPSLASIGHDKYVVRRLYVRMFVTLIEGTIATFRSEALARAQQLTEAERAMLREVTYDLNDKGETFERVLHPPLASSIKFGFRMLAKAYGLKHKPDYSLAGWHDLQEVIRIRNRLTHPKNAEQLQVSSAELYLVDSAELWFLQSHRALLDEYIELMQAEIERLQGPAGA